MGATNFGARTDHWGLATTNLILVESSSVPVARTVERAEDECGDYADIDTHGQNASADLADISVTYELQSGTLNINTLQLGEINANQIASTVSIVTANGAWPRITVSGQDNTETVVAPSGKLNTWTIPDSITLTGRKCAQPFDFTYVDGMKLTDSSYEAAVEITPAFDGVGTVTAHGVSGGQLTQTAGMTKITVAPDWTVGATWKDVQDAGQEEPQAGYETATMSAEKNMDRGTSGS
jgi:hypothetical protein